MKRIMSLVAVLSAMALMFAETVHGEDAKRFPDPSSFKARLAGTSAVIEERQFDINGDEQLDVMVFSTGGEEVYLTILINDGNEYIALDVPVAASYELVEATEGYRLRVGRGTFPLYGDIHGPDKYSWYDFYAVHGHVLVLRNDEYRSFYEDMIPVYQDRLRELEEQLELMGETEESIGEEHWIRESRFQLISDQIEQYRQFIEKACSIIRGC